MAANPRIHVRISERNRRALARYAGEYRLNMGKLVDEALTVFFRPPEERGEATVLVRLDHVQDEIGRLEAAAAFQSDLLLEFIYEWLRQKPPVHPLDGEAGEARAKAGLEAMMQRVLDRSDPGR